MGPTASAASNKTAQRCGVDQTQAPQRVFADPEGKDNWREYKSVREVPELDLDAGESANLWVGRDGHILISTYEPGEDFAAFTDYCFDQEGQLEEIRYEMRTAWGWGYRQEGPISNGTVANQTEEFFNTKTEQQIPKPDDWNAIPDALKPHLYLKLSKLPFSKLLTPTKSAR